MVRINREWGGYEESSSDGESHPQPRFNLFGDGDGDGKAIPGSAPPRLVAIPSDEDGDGDDDDERNVVAEQRSMKKAQELD